MPFNDKPISETEGDSGGWLDNAFGDVTPFSTKSVDTFSKDADTFKRWAEQGKFAVNEEGMKAYIKVCDAFIDGWQDIGREVVSILSEPPPLGSSPYAKKIAEYNVKVAAGDERSLLPNLVKMKDGFEKMKGALKIARKRYNEDDEQSSISFSKFRME